jgi:hypothetical protein
MMASQTCMNQNEQLAVGTRQAGRAEFTQAIDTHWRSRAIEWNRVSFTGNPDAFHP